MCSASWASALATRSAQVEPTGPSNKTSAAFDRLGHQTATVPNDTGSSPASHTVGNVDVWPGAEGWTDLAHALDLRAGLQVAEATVRGAIERRETRGPHNRADFPDLHPALQVNFYVDDRMEPWSEPVPAVPDELREWTERPVEVGPQQLLE